MQLMINCSLIFILFMGLISGEIHYVCEICSCDNLDKPMIVHCDSKKLSTLTNITFNTTIETLTLINNSLTFKSVDDLTKINNITALKSLVLSNNPLGTIPELSLPHLVNLQLENTYLKTVIFPKSYENCTNLQSIVLSNNTLTKLSSDNFKSLSSLTKILIDNAQLTSIDQNAFTSLSKTLQSISLTSNALNSAEFLSTMPNLLSINFDKNKFKQLPKEMIKSGRTKHYFFRNNQIDIIDELSPLFYWMKTNLTDIEIYLNNNPFDCCQSRWFIHYLTGPTNLVKDFSNLTCALPKTYTGRRLIDLPIDLMDCSNGPIHPSNIHLSKLVLILLCLISVVIFILVVVGGTLYRRNKLHFQRRREYESIQGDNLLT
jgi:Leucine-rich repeat (LRR) protein